MHNHLLPLSFPPPLCPGCWTIVPTKGTRKSVIDTRITCDAQKPRTNPFVRQATKGGQGDAGPEERKRRSIKYGSGNLEGKGKRLYGTMKTARGVDDSSAPKAAAKGRATELRPTEHGRSCDDAHLQYIATKTMGLAWGRFW